MFSIIVALSQNYVIGKDQDLLWHISEDLKRFKQITSGATVIMGRKTYLSLPRRPLPNRRNIVLSSQQNTQLDGCEVVSSIDVIRQLVDDAQENFVIGGGSVYEKFLPFADKLYVTWVYKDFDGDTFFPEIDEQEWEVLEQSPRFYDEASMLNYAYFTYKRK
mgnify:FL=1